MRVNWCERACCCVKKPRFIANCEALVWQIFNGRLIEHGRSDQQLYSELKSIIEDLNVNKKPFRVYGHVQLISCCTTFKKEYFFIWLNPSEVCSCVVVLSFITNNVLSIATSTTQELCMNEIVIALFTNESTYLCVSSDAIHVPMLLCPGCIESFPWNKVV